MKRILITGANSYIGTSVEKYLAQWPDQYQVDTIDMVDGTWRKKSFAGYDSVFHVAGIAHIKTKKLDEEARKRYWAVNALLPVEVAQKAKDEGVRQFVFLSSMSVYGEHGSMKHPVVITKETKPNPKDIYGKSKLEAEKGIQLLSSDSFCVCILRPPMIYGPKCKGNYQTLAKAAKVLPIFPNIENQRSMLFIETLCTYTKETLDSLFKGIHFPQNNEFVCTSNMVCAIARFHGKNLVLTSIFNPLIRVLSSMFSVFSKVFGSLVYEQIVRNTDTYSMDETIEISETEKRNG